MSSYNYPHITVAELKEAECVNGWCNDETFAFRDAIAKVFPNIKFIRRSPHALYIYYDHCPYVLGWIGFGNFRKQTTCDLMYVVHARHIESNNYTPGSNQFYMKMSKNIKVAVRNVKKNIKCYTPLEMAHINKLTLSNNVREVSTTHSGKAKGLLEHVIDADRYSRNVHTSKLVTELQHLVNSGYQFIDPTFGNSVRELVDTWGKAIAYSAREVPMDFVHVQNYAGEQLFNVISVEDAAAPAHVIHINSNGSTYNMSNVPEELMGKMAVLSMVGRGEYVDEIGLNIGDGMFYVTK